MVRSLWVTAAQDSDPAGRGEVVRRFAGIQGSSRVTKCAALPSARSADTSVRTMRPTWTTESPLNRPELAALDVAPRCTAATSGCPGATITHASQRQHGAGQRSGACPSWHRNTEPPTDVRRGRFRIMNDASEGLGVLGGPWGGSADLRISVACRRVAPHSSMDQGALGPGDQRGTAHVWGRGRFVPAPASAARSGNAARNGREG